MCCEICGSEHSFPLKLAGDVPARLCQACWRAYSKVFYKSAVGLEYMYSDDGLALANTALEAGAMDDTDAAMALARFQAAFLAMHEAAMRWLEKSIEGGKPCEST